MTGPRRVLFLCTGNSCRSQMAEAIVNHSDDINWFAYSAGTHPEQEINPFTIEVLKEIGIDHIGTPKGADHFKDTELNLLITICDSAVEECPIWLKKGKRIHRPFLDPALARGSDSEVLSIYRNVLNELRREIPKILVT